jgi:glutathione peroxidase
MANSLFDLSARANDGKDFPFKPYEGKVMLVVNTASKCGFTPQYKGLEELYEKYGNKGLVVLGFPCDQFAHQEPGDDAEIASFCRSNFGVTFPLMSKVEVNGENTHPVFAFLKARAPGKDGEAIKWNFTKFLVAKDGRTVTRFPSTTEPEEIVKDIETALAL